VKVKPGAVMSEEDAQEGLRVGRDMAGASPCAMLVEMADMKSATREARDIYARTDNRVTNVLGVALVVRTPLARMIGNFFIGFNRPRRPVRLFTDTRDAELWLQGLLAGNAGHA
jgi:hypothetical protein